MHLSFSTLAAGGLITLAALPEALGAGSVAYTFPPGDAQGWTQVTVPGGTSGNYGFYPTNVNFGNRITWLDPINEGAGIGGLVVTDANNFDARGSQHNTAVMRSPSFTLNGTSASADVKTFFPTKISFTLLAGGGSPTGPANFSALPPNSVDNGSNGDQAYLGVGLRRVSDGAYLLWGRRNSNAQGNAWQTITWDQSTLSAATSADPAQSLYTLDFVDGGHGNWGWIAMDSVTMISETSVVNVSVKPQDIIGAETGSDHQLSVRFSRDNGLTQALDIAFTLEGSAIEGVDFQNLPNFVGPNYKITIPAGKSFVDLPINILSNGVTQTDRAVTVRILSSSDYLTPSANVTTVWISDLPQTGLATVSGPMPTATYLPLVNPLTSSTTAGSLLFYGEGNYTTGFLTIGLRPAANDSTNNGGVDLGRNTAVAANSIYDYLDNKGIPSTNARVAATTDIPISGGHYTMVGEVQFQDANTGTIKSWIWDGQNGSLDYNNPNVVTTFTSGFINTTDQLFLRLDGNSSDTTWTNAHAFWIPGSDTTAVQSAFSQLFPARPFIYTGAPAAFAGESGDNQDLTFTIFRSGPPKGTLNLPLLVSGTATKEDFSTYPSSVTIPDGQSITTAVYHVVPDNLNEGAEILTVGVDSSTATTWLPGMNQGSVFASGIVLDQPFQDWMASNFPGNADGPLADSDHDGIVNLMQFFTGAQANGSVKPQLAPGTPDTLRFLREPDLAGVTGQVLWSTDLAQWHASGESDGTRTVTITEQIAVPAVDNGPETVDAKATVTNGPATGHLFLRLSVSLP